jgi:hypothetical protein
VGKVKPKMEAKSQFKRVKGPDATFESICMNCLLAVGIRSSEEELQTKENQHDCKGKAKEMGPIPRNSTYNPAEIVSQLVAGKLIASLRGRRLTQKYLQGDIG